MERRGGLGTTGLSQGLGVLVSRQLGGPEVMFQENLRAWFRERGDYKDGQEDRDCNSPKREVLASASRRDWKNRCIHTWVSRRPLRAPPTVLFLCPDQSSSGDSLNPLSLPTPLDVTGSHSPSLAPQV